MKDIVTSIAVFVVILGMWVAIPVFAAVVGTGLALLVLHHLLKEYKKELENESE